ncbi:MAG: C4-dicarboxylate ABC transporter substrate-binding protein [Hyphomicrobiales bacterium]|nr:MAG: C4-dicarboxylate ABC transporter substrate-binding protein [Hyphomicrobiales bacterium]
MTNNSTIPPDRDAKILRLLDGKLGILENILNSFSGFAILFLILLAVVQIVGRSVFSAPVPGFIDYVEQSMAIFAFLGISLTQRVGGHVRMELILQGLRGRVLWSVEIFGTSLTMVLIAALISGSWDHFMRAWVNGDSTIDIGLTVWPSKLIIPAALSILFLRLALQLWGYVRLFGDPEREPVAVPLIEDIVEQARHEIEDTLVGPEHGGPKT